MKFSNELEALINAAIADGVITPEEQAALLKKALLSGADPKEVEAEINSRLAQMKATMPPVPPTPIQPAKPKASVHDLDDLIEEYLTDGIITDKERQVLLRKAQELGIDADEADLYIDAQEQKANQKAAAAAAKLRGATCPFCGGSIPQLADKCPHCGQNITAEASKELQEILDALETGLQDYKSSADEHNMWAKLTNRAVKDKAWLESQIRRAKTYFEHNEKVQRLVKEIEYEMNAQTAAHKKQKRNQTISVIVILAISIFGLVMLAKGLSDSSERRNEKSTPSVEQTSQTSDEMEEQDTDDESEESLSAEEKTMDLVDTYLRVGEVKKARKECERYLSDGNHQRSDIQSALDDVVEAMIEKGDYNDVADFVKDGSAEEITDALEKCVSDMTWKDEKKKAKKFIEKYYNLGLSDNDEAGLRKTTLMQQVED